MKRQLRSKLVLCIGFFVILVNLSQCTAAPIFELKEIVSPEGNGIFPLSVNAAGHATGWYYRNSAGVAFFYDGTSVIDLGFSGSSTAYAINDSDQIAGLYDGQAFIWTNGNVQFLGTLGGATSQALGINNLGQAVGASANAAGTTRPFVYSGNQMTELPLPAGFNVGVAWDINDLGQIVGVVLDASNLAHAVRWDNGQVTDLGALGGYSAEARSINSLGDIVGGKINQPLADSIAFLLRNGQPQFFAAGGALDINNRGEIVTSEHYIDPDGNVFTLNSRVLNLAPKWRTLGGTSINDLGVIVGSETDTDAGTARGFILTPTPEPTSGILLMAAGMLLTANRRTRVRSR